MRDTSKITFFIDPKLHEDLKIRIHYDGFGNLSQFFRGCVVSYLEKDEAFLAFLDAYKVNERLQSRAQVRQSGQLRENGRNLMKKLGISEDEIEDVFDIIEEEIPEL